MKKLYFTAIFQIMVSMFLRAQDITFNTTIDGYDYTFISSDGINANFVINESSTPSPDTLFVPNQVEYENVNYTVNRIGLESFAGITSSQPKVISIPTTVAEIEISNEANPFAKLNKINSIIVDKSNPYYASYEGALYTKSLKTLVAFPLAYKIDSIKIHANVDTIGRTAFMNSDYDYIEFPNSLKKIERSGIKMSDESCCNRTTTVVIKDSVTSIMLSEMYAVYRGFQPLNVVVGNGMKEFSVNIYGNPLTLTCRAVNPPYIDELAFMHAGDLPRHKVFVPRKSINQYLSDTRWKRAIESFHVSIEPIEPPLSVNGTNVSLHWVQNFSATSYLLTIYGEENQTAVAKKFVFNADGELQEPSVMASDLSELESHYVDYYSFTITGLNENTDYFYTVKAYAGTEVIDTDSGSFTTQKATALQNIKTGTSGIQKIIRNGQLFIIDHDRKLIFDTAGKQYPYEINK